MNKEILPVLDEISAVLKKHNMAGLFMVGNETHVDWRMEISPSWSCAWIEQRPEGTTLRVRSKLVDYPNKEAQEKTIRLTVGTLVSFMDAIKFIGENLQNALIMISKSVDFLGKSTKEE